MRPWASPGRVSSAVERQPRWALTLPEPGPEDTAGRAPPFASAAPLLVPRGSGLWALAVCRPVDLVSKGQEAGTSRREWTTDRPRVFSGPVLSLKPLHGVRFTLLHSIKHPLCSAFLTCETCACTVLNHFSRVQLAATPWTVAHQGLCPWDSPGESTEVGCHALFQGIFPTQESNPCLTSPALAGGFFTTRRHLGRLTCGIDGHRL